MKFRCIYIHSIIPVSKIYNYITILKMLQFDYLMSINQNITFQLSCMLWFFLATRNPFKWIVCGIWLKISANWLIYCKKKKKKTLKDKCNMMNMFLCGISYINPVFTWMVIICIGLTYLCICVWVCMFLINLSPPTPHHWVPLKV